MLSMHTVSSGIRKNKYCPHSKHAKRPINNPFNFKSYKLHNNIMLPLLSASRSKDLLDKGKNPNMSEFTRDLGIPRGFLNTARTTYKNQSNTLLYGGAKVTEDIDTRDFIKPSEQKNRPNRVTYNHTITTGLGDEVLKLFNRFHEELDALYMMNLIEQKAVFQIKANLPMLSSILRNENVTHCYFHKRTSLTGLINIGDEDALVVLLFIHHFRNINLCYIGNTLCLMTDQEVNDYVADENRKYNLDEAIMIIDHHYDKEDQASTVLELYDHLAKNHSVLLNRDLRHFNCEIIEHYLNEFDKLYPNL